MEFQPKIKFKKLFNKIEDLFLLNPPLQGDFYIHLADLFAVLYDFLERNGRFLLIMDSQDYSFNYESCPLTKNIVNNYVCEITNFFFSQGKIPHKKYKRLIDKVLSRNFPNKGVFFQEILFILLGIDRTCHNISLRNIFNLKDSPLNYWFSTYLEHNKLNPNTPGIVLPKGTECQRGQRLSRFFINLARVKIPPDISLKIKHFLNLNTRSLADEAGNEGLRVACISFINHKAEMSIKSDNRFFFIEPDPKKSTLLEDRLKQIFKILEEENTDIAVFSESVFTLELKQKMATLLSQGTNDLQLIFSGTFPLQKGYLHPHNTCILWNGNGEVLLEQCKMHRCRMDLDQQRKVGLDTVIGGGKSGKIEGCSVYPRTLNILDTPEGRFAILICEDFGRSIPIKTLLIELGVAFIIVPIFDTAQFSDRWTYIAARDYAAEPGSASIISNSGILPNAANEPPSTSFVIHPDVFFSVPSRLENQKLGFLKNSQAHIFMFDLPSI